MPDLAEVGDILRNAIRDFGSSIQKTGSEIVTALDSAYSRSYVKPLLYGGAIGGGLALGGLGASQAIHDLQVSNFGGQPLNPYQYFSPVPYSPYLGYNPYAFGLSQSFDTIFNPLTILIIVMVIIIIIIMIIMASR